MPAVRGRLGALTPYIPGALTDAALAASLVAGILLLLLAKALRRRKRRAWRAVVALLAVSVVLHVVKGLYLSEALITCLMLIALIGYRREFYALGDPRTRWRALAVFVLLAAVDTLLGLVIVSVRPKELVGGPGLDARVEHVWSGLVGMSGPLRFHSDRVADLVMFSLLGLGLLTAITTAYLVFRPPEHPGAPGTGGRGSAAGAAAPAGQAGLPRLLRAAPGQERRLVTERQVRRRLPGRLRRDARQRRPARRLRGLAGCDQAVPGGGGPPCLDAGGDGLQRDWAARCGPARPVWTRWRSATRPSSMSRTSPWKAGRCAMSARWSTRIERQRLLHARSAGSGSSPLRTAWPPPSRRPPGAVPTTERGFSMALGRLGDPAGRRMRVRHRQAGRRAARRSCTSSRGARTGSRWT